jgi:antitoxin component of MazEF toxin-antitoxin module
MQTNVVSVGNSRGVRIPKVVLETYRLDTGDELSIVEQSDGILLRPIRRETSIPPAQVYAEMAADRAESEEWDAWDSVAGDARDTDKATH